MDTFEILLARYKARVKQLYFDVQDDDKSSSMDYHELIQSQRNKPKILVIEDNADDWFLIRWTLIKQFQDTELVWISSEDQMRTYMNTFNWSEQSLPALILLDLYLPSAEIGFNLLKNLKKHKLFANTPVVIISRSRSVEDIDKAYSYASNGYMVKPEHYRDWREAFSLLNQYFTGPVL